MEFDFIRIFEIAIAVAGGASAAAGFIYAAYKSCSMAVSYWNTIRDLHSHFGIDAANVLAEIVRNIEATHGELEIRRRIVERHLQIGIYVCDAKGECTWCNDVLADAFHLDSTEVLRHGWMAAIRKEDQKRTYKAWQEAIDNHLPYKESYFVEPEDRPPWEAVTEAWPVFGQDNKVVCYVGYVAEKK